MKTDAHWEKCKSQASYHAAQTFAFQLREVALLESFDTHGIKVIPKKDINQKLCSADAQVRWEDGPEDWADEMSLSDMYGVCLARENGTTISFYDI